MGNVKNEIPVFELVIPDADKIVEDIENGIEECRKRYVEYAAKKYCITEEQAEQLLNDISEASINDVICG